MIRLRSYDVWDTLLRRRCHPDAVKLHVARFLLLRHASRIVASLRDAHALLALRLDAERELAAAASRNPECDDEYRLDDVLRLWLQRALTCNIAPAALIAAISDEEYAQELAVSYADARALSELSRPCNELRVFISDFYMPAARIAALLNAKGYTDCFDGGVSSSDHLLNKRSGRLFAAVQHHYGVTSAQHLHLGDNVLSDVRMPRKLGIRAQHHRYSPEERLRRTQHRAFTDRSYLLHRIQHRALATAPAMETGARTAFRAGIELAPLFVGFGLFTLEMAQKQNLKQLYFFAREGLFFADVYERLRNAGGRLRQRTPPAHRLFVSRCATFAASLASADPDEMQRLWRAYRPGTMAAWASSLNLDPSQVQGWCTAHGLRTDEALADPVRDPRVLSMLAAPAIRTGILDAAARQKQALLAYLNDQGLPHDDVGIGVVDIGWRGTIQDNLALLLPRHHWHGIYLGLQGFLNPQPVNSGKCAYGPDLNVDACHAGLFRQLPLIEMLCTPTTSTSVVGYPRDNDGRMQAQFSHAAATTAWTRMVDAFQAGVLHAVSAWADEVHVQALGSEELRAAGLARWQQLLDRTPSPLRTARAMLSHDESFGRGLDAPPPQTDPRWYARRR